eukprot:4436503-Amphidinium_carterae.1
MMYLQLPKEGARDAGERRPIALLPQVYRLWCALCRYDVKAWCGRCAGRGEVPVGTLHTSETFALESAVSEPVHATHGMQLGCGHAVDLLHAFLIKTLQSAGTKVQLRKYVDDMVLVAKGKNFAVHLCQAYRRLHRSLTQANMKVNLKKTVVLCNGAKAKRLVKKVWKTGRLPPLKVTTRDLGVDTQWAAWRCP